MDAKSLDTFVLGWIDLVRAAAPLCVAGREIPPLRDALHPREPLEERKTNLETTLMIGSDERPLDLMVLNVVWQPSETHPTEPQRWSEWLFKVNLEDDYFLTMQQKGHGTVTFSKYSTFETARPIPQYEDATAADSQEAPAHFVRVMRTLQPQTWRDGNLFWGYRTRDGYRSISDTRVSAALKGIPKMDVDALTRQMERLSLQQARTVFSGAR